MSETYTAVYAREGDVWVAEIAGQPDLRGQGASLGEAREQVRSALAAHQGASAANLHIIDQIRPPAAFKASQAEVAGRTQADKIKMMSNMTDSKTTEEWADELQAADREPGAVKWLKEHPGVTLGIDQLCHTITLAEEIARWGEVDMGAPEEAVSSDRVTE
ncbi:MAG: hypothetical protein NVSMB32_01300 [Actinomycetota bacterium]